jgi:2-C-methyl-D-erythritol 4-phosphate cytidylyltransferase
MEKSKIALIMAGGKGERMNADIPKQFLEIQGKPILMHTLEVFFHYNNTIQLILVLPALQVDYWKELCKKHSFLISHQIVAGGETRFHSVRNGLKAVQTPSLVAVHDGVRPLVSYDTIDRCFNLAEKSGTAIPVISPVDSIRQLNENDSISVDRNAYKLVQTPQVFDGELLRKAYSQEFSPLFTDDASVVEAYGGKINLVDGNRENIKITTEFDLKIAKILINN